MKLEKISSSPEETAAWAAEISPFITGKVVLLNGNLGAGKTTFVKAFTEQHGSDHASSPTFSICQRYEGDHTILHFDLYRLESEVELENTGFYEMIETPATVFVEWAEKCNLKDILEKYVEIHITIEDTNTRRFTLTL